MRTGKTQQQIEVIKDCLSRNETILVAGLKDPKEYIERLYRDFNLIVTAIPHYVKRNYRISLEDVPPYRVFESGEEKQLTGYEFSKI